MAIKSSLCFEIDPYSDGLTPGQLKRELGIDQNSGNEIKLLEIFDFLDQDERQIMKLLFGLGPRQHGAGSSVATICLFHLHLEETEAVRKLDLAFQKLRKIIGSRQIMRAVGVPEGNSVDPHDLMAKAELEPVGRQIIQKLFMLSGKRKYSRADIVREFAEDGITDANVNAEIGQLIARLRTQVSC